MQQYEYARGDPRGAQSPQSPYSSEISTIIASSRRAVLSRSMIPGVVIDPKGSKDRDDAIWAERLPEGKYRAHITIASVGEFIPQGSLIDIQARERGMTRYLRRSAVEPMLPAELSEDALSLLFNTVRPTLTISVLLGPAAQMEEITLTKTAFRNDRDLTYEDGTKILKTKNDMYHGMLTTVAEVAYLLQERRTKRKQKKGDAPREQDIHRIIEEFMLLGNLAISEYALSHGIPIIFRNHPNTNEDGEVSSVVPEGKAYYSATNKGHKGLRLEAYDQVTSPLRRYPDLHNQRVLAAYLDGNTGYSTDHARTVSQSVNATEYARAQQRLSKRRRLAS